MKPALHDKKVVVVGHITETYGPVQALKDYLVHVCDELYFVTHPLKEGNVGYSEIYLRTRLLKRIARFKNEYIQYLRELLVNMSLLAKMEKVDMYIGMSNFDTIPAILFRKFGIRKILKISFYSTDYSERRFGNRLLGFLYNVLDYLCIRYSDFVFSNTRRPSDLRSRQGLEKRRNIVVRNGVYLDRIPPLMLLRNANKKLYYVGHLDEAHGVQSLLSIMNDLVALVPDIELVVIGSGSYEGQLRRFSRKCRNVTFLGRIENREVLEILSSGGIGLALYCLRDSWVKYCDPVKVKEYLACGCPVVISDIVEIAEEIVKNKAGFRYATDDELKTAILTLVKDYDTFLEFRQNAIKLGQKYDWNKIYDKALSKTLEDDG